MTKNIMIVGVGGQGTLLTSRIIGKTALAAGHDVKLSEVHGMAQRGGSVLLEPVLDVRFLLPAEHLGRVMTDVVTMQVYMRGVASYLREIKEKNTSVWNKLYNLKNSLEKEQDAEEPTIDNDDPVTEDDLPFDWKEDKE